MVGVSDSWEVITMPFSPASFMIWIILPIHLYFSVWAYKSISVSATVRVVVIFHEYKYYESKDSATYIPCAPLTVMPLADNASPTKCTFGYSFNDKSV